MCSIQLPATYGGSTASESIEYSSDAELFNTRIKVSSTDESKAGVNIESDFRLAFLSSVHGVPSCPFIATIVQIWQKYHPLKFSVERGPEKSGCRGVMLKSDSSKREEKMKLKGVMDLRKQYGFTIIELMVVITIVVILTSIGIPSYNATITSNRMSGEINSVLGALNLARSEANKRGQTVSVCPNSGTACIAATDWSSGWQVLLAGSSTQLLISPGVSHGDILISTLSTNPAFTPMGYTFFSGTISLHDQNSTQRLYRCIVFGAGTWVTKQGASCP
jgi:type IV fimbrial biogenesis protein FimT